VIADRRTALEFAALALERTLVGASTRSDRLTVRQLLKAVGGLTATRREAVRRAQTWRSDRLYEGSVAHMEDQRGARRSASGR
jgi:hypothetical protein